MNGLVRPANPKGEDLVPGKANPCADGTNRRYALHQVFRTGGCTIGYRGANPLATAYPFNAQNAHEPFDRASCYRNVLTIHLFPGLACPIDTKVLFPDSVNLWLERLISLCTLG